MADAPDATGVGEGQGQPDVPEEPAVGLATGIGVAGQEASAVGTATGVAAAIPVGLGTGIGVAAAIRVGLALGTGAGEAGGDETGSGAVPVGETDGEPVPADVGVAVARLVACTVAVCALPDGAWPEPAVDAAPEHPASARPAATQRVQPAAARGFF